MSRLEIFGPIICLVLTLLLGLLLTKLGKPYNTVLFTIHKLMALAVIVLTFRRILYLVKSNGWQAALVLGCILLVIGIIGLFSSGAMLSIGGFNHKLLRSVHIVANISLISGFVILITRGQLWG